MTTFSHFLDDDLWDGLAILPLIGETGINNIGLNFFSYGIISMIGLSAVMLGISLVISLISATRMMAISLALFTWIFLRQFIILEL